MKNRMVKIVGKLFKEIGQKQLVMCCIGAFYEPKIPEQLVEKDK